jgi:hypothetical protein
VVFAAAAGAAALLSDFESDLASGLASAFDSDLVSVFESD